MVGYLTEMVLENRPVLCIGGGQVALRKLTGLLACGPRITVVAPTVHPQVAAWAQGGRITHRAAPFAPGDLDAPPSPVLVFAATGQAALNREIARQAALRGLLCNSADDPLGSGFLVPAVVRRGPVVVGVGTAGLSPALARLLKDRLEVWLEPGWEGLVQLFGALRERVKQTIPNPLQRQHFWRETAQAVARERRFEHSDNGPWLEARLLQADGPGTSEPGDTRDSR
ncbi:MAG: bifunctional precorrin-2 dehydrogenase/sirohydrochlorin ferrochelatase [Magnetococcus sp. MYC-9]